MSATFTVIESTGTQREIDEHTESVEIGLKDAANGQDLVDVTLVPGDVTHAESKR